MTWIEASAGSGKTTRLIQAVLAYLEEQEAELSQVVAITFTEKAAGELKLRLRLKLEERRHIPAVERAIRQLDEARFQTIHSFCQEMLQESPVEARVDPVFTVLGPNQARTFFRQACADWFATALQRPGPGLQRLLRRRFQSHDYSGRKSGLRAQLEEWTWKLAEHRHQSQHWTAPPPQWAEQMPELWSEFAALPAPEGAHDLKQAAAAVAAWARARGAQNPAGEEALLVQSLAALKKVPRPGPRAKEFHRRLDAWRQKLSLWVSQANGDLLYQLVQEVRPVLEAYRLRKQASGQLDFLDLLLRAEEWLRDHSPRRPIRYLLVDECQDIDSIQAQILQHLCRRQGCQLTMVGDPKQAIYRFRGGDLAGYLSQRPTQVEQINVNYRSRPQLIDYFNTCFEAGFVADAYSLQCGYAAMQPQRPPRPEGPSLVALPLDNPTPERGLRSKDALRALVPQVCAWIQQCALDPRHICLIFKDLSNNAAAYLEAFDRCGIAHVLLSAKGFHLREEVAALRTLLEAIEWPQDRLSVYACLRGPCFGLQEPELLEYFQEHGHFDPVRARAADDAVSLALTLLRGWHERRNQRSLAQTLEDVLQQTHFTVALAQGQQGKQRVHDVGRFQQLCCQLEAGGASSFRALVEQLLSLAEEGDESEAISLEDDQEGVRLITAHSAKGLEFDVVILADPATPAYRGVNQASDPESGLYVCKLGDLEPWDFAALAEREEAILRAESLRLAYVAATRAREILVVPQLDPVTARTSWLEPLMAGLDRALPSQPGCPQWLSTRSDWTAFRQEGNQQDAAASQAWFESLQRVRQRAAVGLVVTSASSYAGAPGHTVEVQVLYRGDHSRQIGREVHQALAALAWDAVPEEPRLAAVVNSPLWRRAANSRDARREVPLSGPLPEGGWLEGVADLVFAEEGQWTVVDFKTDGDRPEYRRQLSAYVEILKQLFPGATIQAILAQV